MRQKLQKENALVYDSVIKNTDWEGYGFKLENVKKIEPIPINSKLGLWEYQEENIKEL